MIGDIFLESVVVQSGFLMVVKVTLEDFQSPGSFISKTDKLNYSTDTTSNISTWYIL